MAFPPTSAALARALAGRNYNEPTAVQAAVLEPQAAGRDLRVETGHRAELAVDQRSSGGPLVVLVDLLEAILHNELAPRVQALCQSDAEREAFLATQPPDRNPVEPHVVVDREPRNATVPREDLARRSEEHTSELQSH